MTQLDRSKYTGPHWTDAFLDELEAASTNGNVGSMVVSENERVRVWLIEMKPGERLPFHTHVLDYFWTATSPGKALSRYGDGTVAEAEYALGDTKHFKFAKGESMTHDLENTGDTVLTFTTVEFLDGENAPLF